MPFWLEEATWKEGNNINGFCIIRLPKSPAQSRPPKWAKCMIFRFPVKCDILILIHSISYGGSNSVRILKFISCKSLKPKRG